ncbi:MAG: DUF3089 domain-containing protein [Oceanicaulis sp.]
MTAIARLWPKSILWRAATIGAAAFLALLVLAAIVLRDQIFQTALDPGIPFQTYERPPAPDYADAGAWAARPEALDPESAAPAVFFVHPATYDGGSHWNAPFDRPQEIREVDEIVLPNWAAPFAGGDAALYAPRYRQASLYAFMNNREDSIQARLLAYDDVSNAFDRFLAEIGEDRPFILVGVGQGALHGLGLLIDAVAPSDALTKRLAAAYLLEAPVPADLFGGALGAIEACAASDQARCVVSYAAVEPFERGRIEALTDRSMSWSGGEGELSYVRDRAVVCVNPVTGRRDEDYAPARMHRGGAAAEGLSLDDAPSPMAAQTGAQCQNGLLMIEEPRTRALRRPGRLGEDRRTPPYNLFYMDLREDAARRLATVQALLEEEALYAPPLGEPEEIGVSEVKPVDG